MTREKGFKKWYDEDQAVYATPEDSYAAAFSAGVDWEWERRSEQKTVARVVVVQETDVRWFQDKVNYWAAQRFFPSVGTMVVTPAGLLTILMQWTGSEEDAPTVTSAQGLGGGLPKTYTEAVRPSADLLSGMREEAEWVTDGLRRSQESCEPLGGLCGVSKGQHARDPKDLLRCVWCDAALKSEEELAR